jgi:hypothetical protein
MNFLDLMIWAQRLSKPGPGPGINPGGPPPFPSGPDADAAAAAFLVMMLGMLCFWGMMFLVYGLWIAGEWKTLNKAGQPGWSAIIPIYSFMMLAKAAGRNEMDGLLVMIPAAGIYFYILILIDLAKKFGKGPGYAVCLLLFPYVMFPMLGFGSARYIGGKKKKKRFVDDYDDEDEEEGRPRRRRPRDDDEEDEDERPKRRRAAVDDDEDEDERPKRRHVTYEDGEEDERPKRKRVADNGDARVQKKRRRLDDDD